MIEYLLGHDVMHGRVLEVNTTHPTHCNHTHYQYGYLMDAHNPSTWPNVLVYLSIDMIIPDPGFNPCCKIGIDRGHRSPITCAPHLEHLTAICDSGSGPFPGNKKTGRTDLFIVMAYNWI